MVMLWYTYQVGSVFRELIYTELEAFEAADALAYALVNQKGFVSYYLEDGNPEWLEKLQEYRRAFDAGLIRARAHAAAASDQHALDKIRSSYARYIEKKDRVIALYKGGQREAGRDLHEGVRKDFFRVLGLCKMYRDIHSGRIESARIKTEKQSKQLRIMAGSAMCAAIVLGVLLGLLLIFQVLNPLRRLAVDDTGSGGNLNAEDEVRAVSRRVRTLSADIGDARMQLARSRQHLLESEKLALVGKLAAGVAHSIRNPLTSVKMRLFSLGRDLELSSTQKDDFEVISEEIRHLDNILGNFLEFSRPPKLNMKNVSPSDVVDMALDLLRYRLESYGASVEVRRAERLPLMSIDPEQLKEAVVNLIMNACEAGEKVTVLISEEQKVVDPWGSCVRISVRDDGPGIAQDIINRVLEPFFSTKEEGTGLGLSIVDRIVREHGGRVSVWSKEGQGSIFTLTIPKRRL